MIPQYCRTSSAWLIWAGDRNRTGVISLEGWGNNHYTTPAYALLRWASAGKPAWQDLPTKDPIFINVGAVRFELTISCSQSMRLRPAGPRPGLNNVPRVRIELTTHGFSVHCSTTELPRLACCGGRIRTGDLQVMGLPSCQLLYPATKLTTNQE